MGTVALTEAQPEVVPLSVASPSTEQPLERRSLSN
jgi:hypothetical protein